MIQVTTLRHILWVIFKKLIDAKPNAIAIDKSSKSQTNTLTTMINYDL